MELISIQLTELALRKLRKKAKKSSSNEEEEEEETTTRELRLKLHTMDRELQRRKLVLFYFLLRSPVFNKHTLPIMK